MNAPTFSFPILNKDEIFQCLAEINLPMNIQEYKNPTPDFMRGLYYTLVELLVGVQPDDIQQPQFQALEGALILP